MILNEIDSRLNRETKFINRNAVIDNPPKVINIYTKKVKKRSFLAFARRILNKIFAELSYPWYRRLGKF